MNAYCRPEIPPAVFRDESGRVVEYGDQWGWDPPPDDTYSQVSNPERFAPLHSVAEALIAYLRREYELTVQTPPEQTRVVVLVPANPDGARLTFHFTDFPGIWVDAGVRHHAAFPVCGCDACDETWDQSADRLEELVFAVAQGGFVEQIEPRGESTGQPMVGYRLAGTQSGRTVAEMDDTLRADADRLRRPPEGAWQPWRERAAIARSGEPG